MSSRRVVDIAFAAIMNELQIKQLEQAAGIRCHNVHDLERQACGNGFVNAGEIGLLVNFTRTRMGWTLSAIADVDDAYDNEAVRAYRQKVQAAIDEIAASSRQMLRPESSN